MVGLLSTRDIDYLITVYEHCTFKGTARVVDVAKALGVSKSTASLMIKKLVKWGLIERVGRGIRLTKEGIDLCLEIIWRHGVIESALTRLGLSVEEACHVARDIELSIPKHIVDKLWCLLGRPFRCPHGELIVAGSGRGRPTCTCRFNVVRKQCIAE